MTIEAFRARLGTFHVAGTALNAVIEPAGAMAGDVLTASRLLAGQGSVSSGHSSPVALLISAARSSRARSGSTS